MNQFESFIPNQNTVSLLDHSEESFTDYTYTVVTGRALPLVTDGLKPVHRRIIYASYKLGLHQEKSKLMKCARIVGEVMGKYHPHGDSSIYEALVRMAVPFTMRNPLVFGQGNYGTRDRDGAAAMRYTEAKLQPITGALVDDLEYETVTMDANYDGSEQEPVMLPARLPFILMNNTAGVAVGFSSSIASFNLEELINLAKAQLSDMSAPFDANTVDMYITGPDFATGGQFLRYEKSWMNCLETGKGSIKLQGKYHFEEGSRGQWSLVIDELPYGCSTQSFVSKLDVIQKIKGTDKKEATQEMILKKNHFLSLVDYIRDESDAETEIRIVVKPKTSRVSKEELLSFIKANTDFTSSFSINQAVIGLDGKPSVLSVGEIMHQWCVFRLRIAERKVSFWKAKAEKRKHLLEGRIIAISNIEEVVKIIKSAESRAFAIESLINTFSLSVEQAEDILGIRLSQLSRLETFELKKEVEGLIEKINEYIKLLTDKKELTAFVVDELEADLAKFGTARKTEVVFQGFEEDEKSVSTGRRSRQTDALPDAIVSIALTKDGFIYSKQGDKHEIESFAVKGTDQVSYLTKQSIRKSFIIFDHFGRSYSIPPTDIKGAGESVMTLISAEKGFRPVAAFAESDEEYCFLTATHGYGYFALASSLVSKIKAGKQVMTLDENNPEEKAYCVAKISKELREEGFVNIITNYGYSVSIKANLFRDADKGKGLQMISMQDGDFVESISVTAKPLYKEVKRGAKSV